MTVRIFRHYIPTPLLVLAIIEALIFFAAVYLGVWARFFTAFLEPGFVVTDPFGERLLLYPRAVAFAIVMIAIMTAFGLYRWGDDVSDWRYRARYVSSFVVGGITMTVVFYVLPDLFLGRGALALSFVFGFVGTLTARYVFFRVIGAHGLRRRILVVGTGTRAAEIDTFMKKMGPHARFQLVGYLSLKEEQPAVERSRIIEEALPLLSLAQKHRIDEIVVGARERRGGRLSMPELLECKLEGIGVTDISSFFEREAGHVQLDSLNASWMVFSDGFRRNTARDISKRVFDIGVSVVLLVLTLPVMVLSALAIWLESGWPILFRQERVGECGYPFEVLKFRSMRADAEKDGVARWAKKDDPRITRVGRVIRKLRIDELPQVFNVLRGDMSFVGPRPERSAFVRELSKRIPYYPSRHTVKPGITGWAQIRYPYGASVEDAVKKLQYDLYYVKNHTLFLDLIILFQTAQVVLFGRGAR